MNLRNDSKHLSASTESINRPLVVFAGQGLSLADDFNLTRELHCKVPELFERVAEADPNDLDAVLASYRDPQPSETREEEQARGAGHAALHCWMRQLTEPEVLLGRGLCTVSRLCALLRGLSRKRLVVLFTSNVDRACRFAAIENGAEWFFGRSAIGATSLPAMLRWMGAIKWQKQGFHYFPLHGEPDFGSTGAGGLFFATMPHFKSWCPADQGWFSTTAEGLGPHARGVDSTWNVPKYGYGLLRDLLSGSYAEQMQHAGADLLVVGYGACQLPPVFVHP